MRFLNLTILVLAACGTQTDPPHVHVLQPLAVQPPAESARPDTVQTDSNGAGQSSVGIRAEPTKPAASPEQLLNVFVARDVLELSPEVATARFKEWFALKREVEIMDRFEIAGRSPTGAMSFEYATDAGGGFTCLLAMLSFYVGSEAESSELSRRFEKQLTARLGKPTRYPENPGTPYWRLAGQALVYVSTSRAQNDAPLGHSVEVRVSVPDGP